MEPKVTNQGLIATAELLAAYLSARAAIEGVACELSEKFFLPLLWRGVRHFFGITVDVRRCDLVMDDQEPCPGFLVAWKAERRSEPDTSANRQGRAPPRLGGARRRP